MESVTPASPSSEVKGLWFTVGRRYVLENFGQAALDACIAHMGPEHGIILAEALPSMWYPEETLRSTLRALDDVLAKGVPSEYLRIIEEASLLGINHFFRALLRLVAPGTMLRKIPTMWSIMRRGTARPTVDVHGAHAVVHYTDFPYFDDAHYRLLTKAAIQSLMRLCGDHQARVDLGDFTSDSLTVDVRWG